MNREQGRNVKTIWILLAVAILAGCANANLVGMRGNSENTHYSLQDRRAARQHITISDNVPANTQTIGTFSTERCHQYAQDEAPSEATLLDDLMLLAYAKGADGLTDVAYSRESGLFKNCWNITKGTATFFKYKK